MHVFFTIGRILLVAMFIWSGAQKLLDIAGTAELIGKEVPTAWLAELAAPIVDATHTPVTHLLAILTGVVELVGGVLIAFNVGTRGAALLLFLFVLVTTYYFHDFWTMSGKDAADNMIQAAKNVSIMGGFLMLFALGSWRPIAPPRID